MAPGCSSVDRPATEIVWAIETAKAEANVAAVTKLKGRLWLFRVIDFVELCKRWTPCAGDLVPSYSIPDTNPDSSWSKNGASISAKSHPVSGTGAVKLDDQVTRRPFGKSSTVTLPT